MHKERIKKLDILFSAKPAGSNPIEGRAVNCLLVDRGVAAMPYANNKGIRIHYETEGEGPPLVLHHWSLTSMECWYDNGYVAALKNDYLLVLPDARGHGASDKPHRPEAYDLKERVGDIVAVLDHLGIARAHFFGYSMGGWIGFGVGRHAPEHFWSLVIGGQHPYAQSMEEIREFVRYGVENGPDAFVARWEMEDNSSTLSSKAREQMLTWDYEALLAAAQDRESLEAVLPTMRMPCMLLVGGKDEVYPLARKCASQIPNAAFVTLPGLDHGEVSRQSDKVVPHIIRFLAELNQ